LEDVLDADRRARTLAAAEVASLGARAA